MEKEIFDTKKIKLDKFDQAGLVSNLIYIASDFDHEDKVDLDLRAQALAIAGRIDPKDKRYKSCIKQLTDGARVTPLNDESKLSRVSSRLYSSIRGLKRRDNDDNKKCAAYCTDIALRFDPEGAKSAKLKAIQSELKEGGFTANWKGLLGDAVTPTNLPSWMRNRKTILKERREDIPGGDIEKFASKKSNINGLYVRQLSGGKYAGGAASLSAIAFKDQDIDGVQFYINQKVGNMYSDSLEEVAKLMRLRHEDEGRLPSNYRVEIVWEDKNTPIEGDSAGIAMSLLLDALFTGNDNDPKFACTGAITQDGKITAISGVAGKIRGATARDCNLVGIPWQNRKSVADILLLAGIDPLLNIQVFTMKNFDQALAIAPEEKSADAVKAIAAFKEVASIIKKEGESALKTPAVQSQLKEIIATMPNHKSAELLLGFGNGEAPENLSALGSVNEIEITTTAFFQASYILQFNDATKFSAAIIKDAKEALNTIEELGKIIDPRFEPYQTACKELINTISQNNAEKATKAFFAAIKERKKLMSDPAIVEEISG